MAYTTELDARSAFSFLEAASLPEELAQRAAELGLSAMALCDEGGVYGAPRFYHAAKAAGLRPLIGARAKIDGMPATLLVETRQGYRNLCRLLSGTGTALDGLHALARENLEALRERLPVHAVLHRHLRPDQERRNRALIEEARRLGLPLVAANEVHYARAEESRVLDVLTCIKHRKRVDQAGALLEPNAERRLKSPAEMERLFADLPEAVAEVRRLAERLEFTLADLGYRFPDYPAPDGHTQGSWLRELTWREAPSRFLPFTEKAKAQLRRELDLIEKLGLAGYFLVIKDIVDFCRREKILAQGRGSAANSAVCYALSITAVDPVARDLLFERFLTEDGSQDWPDIDLDLPSGDQRERVIQYVYKTYGAPAAAMTANVITFRERLAVRECEKAGLPHMWPKLLGLPRHLGQHSGGMVVCGGRLDEVVPLQKASMPGRVIVQWDKDDCSDLGLVKVDLLGLGMLAVFEEAIPMIERHEGVKVDLAQLPKEDPKVYDLLNAADTVGLFQLESRAQMATLPRHKPRCFYDIVVQVAIIRPGPIVGGMVHPFFDRRAGRAPVTYPHPSLEPILARTLGVPLFQEQVLRMAMTAAGLTGGEAKALARAVGAKRSEEKLRPLIAKLRSGMDARGISAEAREQIVGLISSFALYGFPESHAASFALIAYASAWLKVNHPAAFYASLLNCWPMGFYHPATLVKDAQRRGIEVFSIDVNRSGWKCRWESGGVRLGLRYVKGLSKASGERLEKAAPFEGIHEVAPLLRAGELELLADAGALAAFGLTRREAVWQAAKAEKAPGPLFEAARIDDPSPLSELTPPEETSADYRASSLTVGPHDMTWRRAGLAARGIRSNAELAALPDGSVVKGAGVVIVRQRPGTAKGFVFLTLEDETGFCQAIISPTLFERERALITGSPGLVVEGTLQNKDGAPSVKARRLWPLETAAAPSRDFH